MTYYYVEFNTKYCHKCDGMVAIKTGAKDLEEAKEIAERNKIFKSSKIAICTAVDKNGIIDEKSIVSIMNTRGNWQNKGDRNSL